MMPNDRQGLESVKWYDQEVKENSLSGNEPWHVLWSTKKQHGCRLQYTYPNNWNKVDILAIVSFANLVVTVYNNINVQSALD